MNARSEVPAVLRMVGQILADRAAATLAGTAPAALPQPDPVPEPLAALPPPGSRRPDQKQKAATRRASSHDIALRRGRHFPFGRTRHDD